MIKKSHSSQSGMEALRSSSVLGAKGLTVWGFLTQAFSFAVGIAALPLRLFLRKNLGERAINPGTFILSIALHIYYFTIFDIVLVLVGVISLGDDNLNWKTGSILGLFILFNPYFIFLVLVIRKGIKHFKQKIREAKSNEIFHSYSRGESVYFSAWEGSKIWGFEVNEDITRLLVEPKSIFKYGIVTFFFCLALSLYLILIYETEQGYVLAFLASLGCTGLVLSLDAICLFLEELSMFMDKRDKVLDMLDGQDDMKEIIDEKTKIEKVREVNQLKKVSLKLNDFEDEDVKID